MKFSAIVVIAPEELEQQAIASAKAAGATGITLLSGRGLGSVPKKTFFGLTFEGSQIILLMVVAKHLELPILESMQALLVQEQNSRGIAFTLPIEHLVGVDMGQMQLFKQHLRELNDNTP